MILIIDDDSAIRSSLSFMLKRAKYDVQAVPGPKEAIEIVRSVAPQLILMDMNFTLSTSGEEGLTLLKQVKVFRPDVPVVLMTAWGSYPACRARDAGRCIRLYYQTLEQRSVDAKDRNCFGTDFTR